MALPNNTTGMHHFPVGSNKHDSALQHYYYYIHTIPMVSYMYFKLE